MRRGGYWLGNTRLLATPNGSPVQGTTAHYLPYGDYRGSAPTATPLTERGYTGHHENREIGLTYMNARFYSPTSGRFLTADTLIPSPTNPQSANRYSYVLGNPLTLVDPTGHYSCYTHGQNEHCLDDAPLPPKPRVHGRVFYLNEIGNEDGSVYGSSSDPRNSQGYYLYMASLAVGTDNVTHIPIYHGTVFNTRIRMLLEAFDISKQETRNAANAIIQSLLDNPLQKGERLIIIGSSGGGTIAIEILELLRDEGIFVDQIILRGSPVNELHFGNFGRIDYITSNFDYYNSIFIDLNSSDNTNIYRHRVDFWGHTVRSEMITPQIGVLIWELLIAGAN